MNDDDLESNDGKMNPLGSGHILPYIPPLVLIPIQDNPMSTKFPWYRVCSRSSSRGGWLNKASVNGKYYLKQEDQTILIYFLNQVDQWSPCYFTFLYYQQMELSVQRTCLVHTCFHTENTIIEFAAKSIISAEKNFLLRKEWNTSFWPYELTVKIRDKADRKEREKFFIKTKKQGYE